MKKSAALLEHEKYLKQRQKNAFLSSIILGGQDGIVNVLGVLLAVASATNDARIVVIAGIAAAFTESVSMLAVAYTSARADEDFYKSEEERERKEIREIPHIEKEEIRHIYYAKGFRGKQLDAIIQTITSNEQVWLDVMMREELQMEKVDLGHARKEAGIVGVSVVIGSLFPLIPFLLALPQMGVLSVINAGWIAAAASVSALLAAGWIKAKLTTGVPWKSALEMGLVGGLAALLGFLVGSILRVTV